MKIDALIKYFNNFEQITIDEVNVINDLFHERSIRKRQYILQSGDTCKYCYFVVEGCFRMFMVDEKGKEHNLQFAVENWWLCDLVSFHEEEVSNLYIEALENSIVMQISKKDVELLYDKCPKFDRIFRRLAENALVSSRKRILQCISSTAEERYLSFAERYPYFFNRVSNVQIASYLGVTPEFLSTIRKKLTTS